MVIRAGVDDRQMTSALGINIQTTFAIAFLVGSALAAFGGDRRRLAGVDRAGPRRRVAPLLARRRDHRRHGLARGRRRGLAALRARVHVRRRVPADRPATSAARSTRSSSPSRSWRSCSRSGRRVSSGELHDRSTGRSSRPSASIGVAALVVAVLAPTLFSGFWLNSILTQAFIFGIGAASLIFLSAYGGMISLAQTGADGDRRLRARRTWSRSAFRAARPRGSCSAGIRRSRWSLAVLLTVAIGLVFGAVASRSFGIYFLMLTLTYTVIAFLLRRLGDAHRRLLAGRRASTSTRPASSATSRPTGQRLYYITLIISVFVYLLVRYLVRTPFGISLQGIRDEPLRMASLGYNVALHRTLAFGIGSVHRGARRRPLRVVVRAALADHDGPRRDDPAARDRGDRRAPPHRGRVARRGRVPRDQQRDHEPHPARRASP